MRNRTFGPNPDQLQGQFTTYLDAVIGHMWESHPGIITQTNRMHLVLFDKQKKTFRPQLAAVNRILISVMQCAAHPKS
jgi:hypothetical protein